LACYKSLTEEQVKQLIVDDKWMASLEALVKGEMDRISQHLAQRIKQLANRYRFTLPEIKCKVEELVQKVDVHLKKMGFSW
jgi:type I restriction enzyme M protein